MTKILFCIASLLLISLTASVIATELADPVDTGGNLNKSEPRAAAFFPMGKKFRDIYGDVGTSLQLEQTRTWKNHRYLELWGNVEWIFMGGHGKRSCGSTEIDILNISLGLKSIGKVYRDFIFLYAGIGPNLGIVFIENKMECCINCEDSTSKHHSTKVAIGGIAKTGAQFLFTPHFYLDLFTDYLYMPVHFKSTQDVGGFKVGGGLGARF